MNLKSKPLSRRTALRGMGAVLALPYLDIMGSKTLAAATGPNSFYVCTESRAWPDSGTWQIIDVTVLGLVGGAPGAETPRVADSSAPASWQIIR